MHRRREQGKQGEGRKRLIITFEKYTNKFVYLLNLEEVNIAAKDRVNIIQHPGGDHKQIALYHNIIAYTDNKRIQYLTDTMPGSSGSPVFDSQWRVVALHHSGGWIVEPGTKRQVYRNEGININCIIEGFKNIKTY